MTLYSIGYATKPAQTLIEQLQQFSIDVVADIRSVPYSAAFKEYHREALQKALAGASIRYVYLGEELGPRSIDDAHYNEQGQVQFQRLMGSDLFISGIERLQNGLGKNLNIALLCAEKDPAICHRSLLVSYYLERETSIKVQHITHDGKLESQEALEQRLVCLQDMQADLITDTKDLAKLAYDKQVLDRAYCRK